MQFYAENAERLEEMASIGLKDHFGEALDILDKILDEAIRSLQAERDQVGAGDP